MRHCLLIILVTVWALTALTGCNKPPDQPVEMTPAPEPTYADDKPRLTEIRPVDQGVAEDPAGGETTPPLSQAARGRAYVVQKGDTYWRIAATQLGNGHRWKEIEALNPGVNMNALKVGQTIRIPAR